VSPQRSNRDQLLNGTVRCLERLPLEQVTARVIAEEAGANPASINYHFGSKDELVTAAIIEGLDRWLDEVSQRLAAPDSTTPDPTTPTMRFSHAHAVIAETRADHAGLVHSFIAALARAPHDPRIREQLASGFRRTRPAVAGLLDLGDDRTGNDAAGLALALFYGLLIQVLLDEDLAIDGERMEHGMQRLLRALPAPPT
jgi:AcrR family transcriptional regulator